MTFSRKFKSASAATVIVISMTQSITHAQLPDSEAFQPIETVQVQDQSQLQARQYLNDASTLWRGLQSILTQAKYQLNRIQAVNDRYTVLGFSFSLSENKQSLREKIDDIMMDSARILGGSELSALKRQVNEKRERIMNLRTQLTVLSDRVQSAVEDRSWYQYFFVSTRAEIQKSIQDKQAEIAQLNAGIGDLRKAMIAYLQASSVFENKENIEKQVDALLYTVTGDSDILLISAFENLKKLTLSLEQSIPIAPTDAAKKNYFGNYALLVRALIVFHQDYITKTGMWDAKLVAVKMNSEKIIRDSRRILQSVAANTEVGRRQAQQLNVNIQLNERVVQLATRYQNYLKQSQDRVRRGLLPLLVRYEVAENTYNTFQNIVDAGAIIEEIRETALGHLTLELPEMAIVVDSISLEEIENLNLRLLR